MKSGKLNFLNPLGHSRPVMGLLYLLCVYVMLPSSSLQRNKSLPYKDTCFGTTPEMVPFWGTWIQNFNLRAISVRGKNREVRKEKRRGRKGRGKKIRDKRDTVNSNYPILLVTQSTNSACEMRQNWWYKLGRFVVRDYACVLCPTYFLQGYYHSSRKSSVTCCWSQDPRSTATRTGGRAVGVVKETCVWQIKCGPLRDLMAAEISNRNCWKQTSSQCWL